MSRDVVVGREETADEDCGSWRCFGGKDSILLQKAFVKGICPLVVWRAMTFIFECSKMEWGGRRWRTKTVAVGAGKQIV